MKLIEVIAAELRKRIDDLRYPIDDAAIGYIAGSIADAIIREIGLRELRGAPPMPEGPWFGSG